MPLLADGTGRRPAVTGTWPVIFGPALMTRG
jgi:hypothetical protein